MSQSSVIRVRGARHNNLKGFDLDIPLGKMTVVTGLSGSGKSSLVFDTLYAEGQRRYVETFSPYARQFLERLDQPRVDSIEGIPPAIAIQQGNTVKTSRSSVGTLTELCDYFKLLMPHRAVLVCPGCGTEVRSDTAADIFGKLSKGAARPIVVAFPVAVPPRMKFAELGAMLMQQGYRRWWDGREIRDFEAPDPPSTPDVGLVTPRGASGWPAGKRSPASLLVIQDRVTLAAAQRGRFIEAAETAFRAGKGHLVVITLDDSASHHFSKGRHCARCSRSFPEPTPSLFSFNSPVGACPKCRGFGRTIEIDEMLVIPNRSLSLRAGVIKPWQSGVSAECQDDLLKWCRRRRVNVDTPLDRLPAQHRGWVMEGDPDDPGDTGYGPWYGVRGYFRWLESKSYKMHMRVLLSRYRTYRSCATCSGTRFQPETLNYRLDGKSLGDLYGIPIRDLRGFVETLGAEASRDAKDPCALVVREILSRLRLLGDVGLDYLTLDRSARTLSGGEVQRVNLTTCLGSAMVNTLFILDEPSVGLHPRDVDSLIRVLHALRDRGNTLVVVEHEPSVIRAADRLVDLGPGAGEQGGKLVLDSEIAVLAPGCRASGPACHPSGERANRNPFPPPDGVNAPVYSGTAGQPPSISNLKSQISNHRSLTLDYLSGRQQVPLPEHRRAVDSRTPRLVIEGAAENNLKHLRVDVPLARFVCVTGVSGSGKSTLVHRVLYENLQKLRGKGGSEPGRCDGITGYEGLGEVVLVDQSPLSRTSRSNPAVYVGAWEPIRDMLASLDESRRNGYTPGSFSFNAGDGRCQRCGGLGYEKVEMQFLPDVQIECPECHGRRFRPEILEVRLGGKNVADLLRCTISEAASHLESLPARGENDAARRPWARWRSQAVAMLRLLEQVGLDYLRMGQPVNMLSGGEAQRLKLCGFLAESLAGRETKGALLIFDEPTTGLHFDDVRRLVGVLQQLVDQGHSVLVIEHNMELVKCADWIVDLGPEAGDRGGEVVACGTPEEIAEHPTSHTGRYLRPLIGATSGDLAYIRSVAGLVTPHGGVAGLVRESLDDKQPPAIRITNAREHNLKNLSLAIPRDQFVVVTGLSGSGKSTLVFDIVFAEGQRRFLDCMSAYARQYVEQMSRPDMDRVEGIPPTVAIEQRVTRGGWKSTVATITEAYHFIRLLYAKVGVQHCPECRIPIQEQSEDAALGQIARELRRRPLRLLAPAVRGRKGFHDEVIAWAAKHGIARLRVDGRMMETSSLAGGKKLSRYAEHTIEFDYGLFEQGSRDRSRMREALRAGRGMVVLADTRGTTVSVVNTARACRSCGRSFEPLDPRDFSFNSPAGWCSQCFGYGVVWRNETLEALEGEEEAERDQRIERRSSGDGEACPCPRCHGARLKTDSLHVRVGGRAPGDLNAMSAHDACDWFSRLRFSGRERQLARDVVPQIVERLRFMREVGLNYLGLGRAAVTLSGGEAQRIRLASQLGSNLRGVLYILDEPTIGLHSRDNERLLKVLDRLKARGNSLLVVEHDEETMRRADWIIDLGPGAGREGGEVVWAGAPRISNLKSQISNQASRTLEFLTNPMRHPLRGSRRDLKGARWFGIEGATLHNLKNVRVRFPVGRLTVVTGVSGAGKSSLVRGTLLHALRQPSSPWRKILKGRDLIGSAYEVDQSPIGKTPRSCPATYLGIWDEIRRLFAATPAAKIRGYTASRFSFNVATGRCESCEGQGRVKLAMSFMPDAYVPCEACGGTRFGLETREILYRDRDIAKVLAMSVEEAADFFSFDRRIAEPLRLLADTGLGYLSLGQSSPTLSGGEAQRMKLVSELMRGRAPTGKSHLYVLEEPTIGLHFADVEKLIGVLHKLVDGGHTAIVIEHNMDLIAEADYVVDVGPEGGEQGGRVVAAGTPEEIARCKASHTGRFLRRTLKRTHSGA